jgi:hypothetical protein
MALSEGGIHSSNGGYVKAGVEPGPEWAGPASLGRFGPVQPRPLSQLLLASLPICVHLHVGL